MVEEYRREGSRKVKGTGEANIMGTPEIVLIAITLAIVVGPAVVVYLIVRSMVRRRTRR